MTDNTNNNNLTRHKMIDPTLHKKYFNYVLRSNKYDNEGQWTYDKIINILTELELTDEIEGLDLKTENIHDDEEETTYKHFEISFKNEEGYLKFLYSGYSYRDRTVFPYPKENEDKPTQRPTNDRMYYINVTNVPLGADHNDLRIMTQNHIDRSKIDYEIQEIRNIGHKRTTPPMTIKTGHWEIRIKTKTPLRPKDDPAHRISNTSLFFSRLTPIRVLNKNYEDNIKDIQEGRKEAFKRFINFSIPQISTDEDKNTIMTAIRATVDRETTKFVNQNNVKITIRNMPHINKNIADITIDRRLQVKINFGQLTTNLAAVRPTVGKYATDFKEADRLFAEHNKTLTTKNITTDDASQSILTQTANTDKQETALNTSTTETEPETENIETLTNTNETMTEAGTGDISSASTTAQTEENISSFDSTDANENLQNKQNPFDNRHDPTEYRQHQNTGETDEGHEGGSEMRAGVISPSMSNQSPSTDDVIPPTQHSQNAIKHHKKLYAASLLEPQQPPRNSPLKMSLLRSKNKRNKESDGEDKTSKKMKIDDIIQRTDILQIADSHIDLTEEIQLIQDMKDIEKHRLQINRNNDTHRTALATIIILQKGDEDLYNGPMTEELITGKGALLYNTHGPLKEEHDKQKHIAELPTHITNSWKDEDRKQTAADKKTRINLINNLIDNINERNSEMS